MATLTNTKIKDTYKSLLKVSDNGNLEAGLQEITDGEGNASGVQLNTGGDLTASGTVAFGSLKDSGENITIAKFVDEADGIAGNDNDTSIPTSAAVKDYVDTKVTAEDLDFAGDTGTGAVDLDSQTFTIAGTANEIETSASGQTITIGLPNNVNVSGNLAVDTNTLYVDAASNEVGIGTNSPNETLEVGGNTRLGGYLQITATTTTPLNTSNPYISREGAGGIKIASRQSSNADAIITFDTVGSERMRIDSSGYLRLAGAGIQFNGDTAAANALDDYEEGTWTPDLQFGGGSSGITYSSRAGAYTKIGRQVTLTGYLALSSVGVATGVATITGLPFALPANSAHWSASVPWIDVITFTGVPRFALTSGTSISLQSVNDTGVGANLTNSNFTTGSAIIFNISYFV